MFSIQYDTHNYDHIQQYQRIPVNGIENTQKDEADHKTENQRITADLLPDKGARVFPGDDIEAAVPPLMNTDRMLYTGKFIGEKFHHRLE